MRTFILILLAVGSVATASDVYRWTDDNGEVNYSDRPHEDAERVTLPSAQTFSAPAPQRRSGDSGAARDEEGKKKKDDSYGSVRITSPNSDEVLWNTGGVLNVSVNTQPGLRRGHTLMIYLDGQVVGNLTGNQRATELTGINRGEHKLNAEVRDASGDIVGTGNTVNFTVQQTSVQNPNNPNVARPTPR
jgi:hypothetical protein